MRFAPEALLAEMHPAGAAMSYLDVFTDAFL